MQFAKCSMSDRMNRVRTILMADRAERSDKAMRAGDARKARRCDVMHVGRPAADDAWHVRDAVQVPALGC